MNKFFFLGFFFVYINYNLQAQGCSDAGACSIGGFKEIGMHDMSYVALNMQMGEGEQRTKIYTPQIEAFFRLKKRSGLQFKFPYVFTNGNLGSTNGFGDITAVFSYKYYDTGKWRLGLSAGLKFGVNNANKKNASKLASLGSSYSLPMPYQTSLGTHDLLIGFDARYNNKWLLGLAFQMPVYNFNNNGFDTAIINSSNTDAKQYFTSAKLLRRPDIVFRIDRQLRYMDDKLIVQFGLLPIYHLGHDRFTDTSGISHALSGSKGLTLNFTLGVHYTVDKHFSLVGRIGEPLITRKVRPDGLTRHSVVALELRYNF